MAAYDNNNIFARILRGEIPCQKVHEDDHVLAIMDVMPQAEGHVLVLPKKASRNLLDADPAVLGPVMAVAQKIGNASMKAFAAGKCMWFGVTMETASMPSLRLDSAFAISRKSP